MERYAERLDFEAAARVRDQLQGLDQLTADQKMSLPDSSVSRDVVALASDERLAAVQLFQMRAGKLVGRLGYMADAEGLDPGLILQRVIEEHYSQVDAVEIPPELLVQHSLPQQTLLEEWLTEQRERRVQIHCPKQRQKADLIELLQRNAEFELLRAKQGQEQQALATEDLAQLLELPIPPVGSRVTTSAISRAVTPLRPRWCSSTAYPPSSTTANTKFGAAASVLTAMTLWRWLKSCGGGFDAGPGQSGWRRCRCTAS